MRKLSVLLAVLILAGVSAVQGQDYWNPPTLENRNASGFAYYMLEVPNPASIVIDARDNDWAWFDPEYVLTFEEWRDEAERPFPSRADYDITTKMGWKGAPENKWYVFMAIHDDTLKHGGTTVNRWAGDMIGFILDPQDHGRTRSELGYSQEYVAAPGNVNEGNFLERYPESDAQPTPLTWREFGQAPYLVGAVRVEPAEGWAQDLWTSDTGGDTYYEWHVSAWDQFLDAGPSGSTPRDLNAQAGEDGAGLPFVFFGEDGDTGAPDNDMTTRGAEGSARQYFSLAYLLRVGEYATPTAVEQTTWGRIKSTF